MKIVRASEGLSALLTQRAIAAEAILKGALSDTLGSTHRYLSTVRQSKAPAVVAMLRAPEWPQRDVQALRHTTARLAAVAGGLETGKYELAGWARESANGSIEAPTLGVVKRGSLDVSKLELWPLLPVLVVVAIGAALTGAWILADLYLEAKNADAQATRVRAQADARFEDAIRTAKTEEERAQLLAAYETAKNAAGATPPGWILQAGQKLARLASDVVTAEANIARNFVEDAWPWLLLLLLVLTQDSRRRRKS